MLRQPRRLNPCGLKQVPHQKQRTAAFLRRKHRGGQGMPVHYQNPQKQEQKGKLADINIHRRRNYLFIVCIFSSILSTLHARAAAGCTQTQAKQASPQDACCCLAQIHCHFCKAAAYLWEFWVYLSYYSTKPFRIQGNNQFFIAIPSFAEIIYLYSLCTREVGIVN